MTILGIIAIIGGIISAFLFRKGGPYNPMEPKDFTELPYMPEQTIDSTSVPFNHVLEKTVTASTPPEATTSPVEASSTPKTTLADFLKWQWQLEGAVPANNNPGNYKFFYGGYMPIYGDVKRSIGGFAMFPTLAQGKLYATTCTKGVIKHHPELTILTYLGGNGYWKGYAPASDNNDPLNYATFVASHLGVGINFPMKNLT